VEEIVDSMEEVVEVVDITNSRNRKQHCTVTCRYPAANQDNCIRQVLNFATFSVSLARICAGRYKRRQVSIWAEVRSPAKYKAYIMIYTFVRYPVVFKQVTRYVSGRSPALELAGTRICIQVGTQVGHIHVSGYVSCRYPSMRNQYPGMYETCAQLCTT